MDPFNALSNDAAFEFYRQFVQFYVTWFPVNRMLEIGSQHGQTTTRARLSGADYIVCIDPFEAAPYHASEFFQGTSDDYFKQFKGESFDLVFIDGDHDGDQVWRDIKNAMQHLTPNGLILLHDTFPPSENYTSAEFCGTAYRAAIRARENPEWEVYTFRVTYGLTLIGRKGSGFPWQKL